MSASRLFFRLLKWRFVFSKNCHASPEIKVIIATQLSFRSYCIHSKHFKSVSDPGIRVLFLGNDGFSLESLKILTAVVPCKESVTVVTTTAENVVGKYVKKNGLIGLTWKEFKQSNTSFTYDVGVVASFGHLIPKAVIEKCKMGILNVHGSILPKYRGAAPIVAAIMNGDAETGVSIMQIAPHRFDVGPILAKQTVKIHPHVRAPELTRLMASVGAELLRNVLQSCELALQNAIPQDEKEASTAPKLTPEMGLVDWESKTALEIYNRFRGLYGTHKMFSYYRGRRIDLNEIGLVQKANKDMKVLNDAGSGHPPQSIKNQFLNVGELRSVDFSNYYGNSTVEHISAEVLEVRSSFKPGQVYNYKNFLLIKCAKDTWVFVRLVKIGSKWMSGTDFRNGYLSKNPAPYFFDSDGVSTGENAKEVSVA